MIRVLVTFNNGRYDYIFQANSLVVAEMLADKIGAGEYEYMDLEIIERIQVQVKCPTDGWMSTWGSEMCLGCYDRVLQQQVDDELERGYDEAAPVYNITSPYHLDRLAVTGNRYWPSLKVFAENDPCVRTTVVKRLLMMVVEDTHLTARRVREIMKLELAR